MPLPRAEVLSEGQDIEIIEAISDHVAVIRGIGNKRDIYTIPLRSLRSDDLSNAVTFKHPKSEAGVFFLDDCTMCILHDRLSAPAGVTFIRGTDPEFKQTTTHHVAVPRLDGCFIHSWKRLKTPGTTDQKAELLLWFDFNNENDERICAKTSLSVTSTTAICGDFIPTDANDRQANGISERGAFVHRSGRSENSIFLDTGDALMYWKDHWIDDGGDFIYEVAEKRWIIVGSQRSGEATRKTAIYDAASRSEEAFIEYEMDSTTVALYSPSLKVSPSGAAILVVDNRIYQFKSAAVIQPLEVLAAMSAFNQLASEMRDAINENGPYNYETFVRMCCAQ